MAVLAGILSAPVWLPSGIQEVWNYALALALKTIAWDERGFVFCCQHAHTCYGVAFAVRGFLKQIPTTPPRGGGSAIFVSEEGSPVRRIDFD